MGTANKMYLKSEIPQRHRHSIDDEASPPKWVATRDRVLDATGSGYLIALVGGRGPGKTQIAEQAVAQASVVNRSSLYVRAMTIFLRLRATFHTDAEESESSVIEVYREPRLLVIDEMQERGETAWEDRILTHLIDLRYGDMTDTLLVANLKPAAFSKSVGPSIAERMREAGGVIECAWPSFRSQKKV